GNLIDTTAGGTAGLANGGAGVLIEGGATANTIGGTLAGMANVIAFNSGNGVQVGTGSGDAALGNSILQDSIFSNRRLGIDVADSAPQPAPTLGIATTIGSQTTVTGSITGAADTTIVVELFANPAGTSQGETYLGSVDVATNAAGLGYFTYSTTNLVAGGLNITATATDSNGNTSEFSRASVVQTSAVNVTSNLKVKFGGLVFNRRTREFSQTVTITDASRFPIAGPINLVLLNLQHATLANASGTFNGNPYLTILASGTLDPGQSLTVTLIFADPTLVPPTYQSEFLAGPLPPPKK
ncbi:MAG: hypothetical protein ACYC61_23025, partial [Isosphaeraceae bacterium]